MKNFEILLNHRYTATTQAISSGLELQNDYYMHVNQNGGGIVNQYNVRGYLNDPRNQQITNDFFAFLTGSTSQDQALNILTADKKLADVFNDYYQRVIVSATQISNTSVVQQNLTGANQIIGYEFLHPWSGYAPSKQLTGITQEIYDSVNDTQAKVLWEDFTDEQSYYIPVCLERGTNQLARYHYDLCDVFINAKTARFYPQFSGITNSFFGSENISNIISNINDSVFLLSFSSSSPSITASTADTRVHTLLDCFVDLNLETNENTGGAAALPKVSFQFGSYNVNEGDVFQIRVGLDAPSITGIEQATINLVNPSLNAAIFAQDYTALEGYPATLAWSAGEQYKFLSFTANTDFFLENTETYLLQIANIINLDPGLIINTSINIKDTTVLRSVSLTVLPPAIPFQFAAGSQLVTVPEGGFIDMALQLDGPAFGVENITLSLVLSASTIGGTLGPSTNPATLNVDYSISATSMTFSFSSGETQKTFRFSAFTDSIIETFEGSIFELQNPQFCLINPNFKALAVSIQDTTGGYKYVHLNFGKIYSEFGSSTANSLMRQINPQPNMFGNYSNIYINQYNSNLIEYGTTINFADYSGSYNSLHTHDSIIYDTNNVKLKVTNLGTIQSIVNGVPVNTGQTIIVDVPGNDFILTATTNSDKNNFTTLFDYANYKIEIVNNYSGSSIFNGMSYLLRALNDTLSTTKTLSLGTYSLSGMTTSSNNITNQYRLRSKYKSVNTGRPNTGTYNNPVYVCPPVATFNYSISNSEFYAVDIENVSVFGIIFLNFDQSSNYTSNYTANYDSFDFMSAGTVYGFTCAQTNSSYNGLDYISIPFHLEP